MSRACLGQKEHRHNPNQKNINENFGKEAQAVSLEKPLKRLGVKANPKYVSQCQVFLPL
jgi:hypothetical protein